MTDNKVTFGVTSKGKPPAIHKQYKFVRHRKYTNGNIQWRCKCYKMTRKVSVTMQPLTLYSG